MLSNGQDASYAFSGETETDSYIEGQGIVNLSSFNFHFLFLFLIIILKKIRFISFFLFTHADNNGDSDLSKQNKEIHLELAKKMKILNSLKAKVIMSVPFTQNIVFFIWS